MIDFHYIQRPGKLTGFIRRGDFISIVDSPDSAPHVYMRINQDGSDEDPKDYPDNYFRFARHFEDDVSETISETEE